MDRISSRHNARFRTLREAITDPRRSGFALADGMHLVAACIEHGLPIRTLLLSDSGIAAPAVVELAERCGVNERLQLSDGLFRELTGVANPIGIAAVFDIPQQRVPASIGDIVLLEAVQDSGNVGAIIRTAAAAGVSEVLLGAGCAGAWSMRVLRAAQGAHFVLAIRENVDPLAEIAAAKATAIATVANGGRNLYELDLGQPVLWMLGNEGAGLSAEVLAAARLHARIPLVAGTESLNVAAATAICLFEGVRQRRPKQKGPL